jgi:hypothetical protein
VGRPAAGEDDVCDRGRAAAGEWLTVIFVPGPIEDQLRECRSILLRRSLGGEPSVLLWIRCEVADIRLLAVAIIPGRSFFPLFRSCGCSRAVASARPGIARSSRGFRNTDRPARDGCVHRTSFRCERSRTTRDLRATRRNTRTGPEFGRPAVDIHRA